MPYFAPSLTSQSFAAIAQRLSAELTAATPRLRALTEAQAAKPRAPGKWSSKQILGHLIDSASNNHQRFVRGQLTSTLVDPGYAQREWVESQRYEDRSWSDLVELWSAYNRHLVHVIAAIPEGRRETPVHIGTDPAVTLSFVALDYVAHIEHHLGQIFG